MIIQPAAAVGATPERVALVLWPMAFTVYPMEAMSDTSVLRVLAFVKSA